MIANEKQYQHAVKLLRRLRNQITHLDKSSSPSDVHPDIHAASLSALQRETDRLGTEITSYEALQGADVIEVNSLSELPTALMRARVARGWTQRELAERVGLREQQVQRYEAQRYRGVALDRMQEIAARLGINAHVQLNLLPLTADMDPRSVLNWRRASLALITEAVQEETGEPIRGRVALQKLLLMWNEQLGQRLGTLVFGHEPLHLGGYDEQVNADVEALRAAGIMADPDENLRDAPESDNELYERVSRRLAVKAREETYELTRAGLRLLREFLESDESAAPAVKSELEELARELAKQAGQLPTEEYYLRTYERFPLLAENSILRDKVVARIRRRRQK